MTTNTTATPNLDLPYIASAQAQKHVTHNEALRGLDAIVQLAVASRSAATPPPTPADGDRYVVGSPAIGAWAGHEGHVAAFQDGAWMFYAPRTGWIAWVADEETLIAWEGSAWVVTGGGAVNPADLVGVNTMADTNNRLAVKSDAILHSHDDVTPGSGDARHTLNKATSANTASVVFQNAYSGRAEFGLTGDDDLHVKVSPDGATWHEALLADRNDGRIAIQGLKIASANYAPASSMIFTPGGDGTVSLYRVNTLSGQHPRTATIASIAGDQINLVEAVAETFFSGIMGGVSYARIWNTTRSADQHSAWASAYVSANAFRVENAVDLIGWQAGDTVQIGDPTSIVPSRCITLDISPMLTNLFGVPFRQTGIVVKANIIGGTDGQKIGVTPSGASGSFVDAAAGPSTAGVTIIPCTELSPISNSNLVRVRETFATDAGIRLISSMAVFK